MAVRAANRFRQTIRSVIEPALDGNSEEEIDARVELLLICMHGLGLQASVHSGSGVRSLPTAVEFAFKAVLSTTLQPDALHEGKAA